MPTLIYKNDSFECTTAIKGDDYIHLLDADGIMTSAFDGITDFSDFTLENGSYTSPTVDHNCYVAVVRDDGTIGKGGHTCADIGSGINAIPKTEKGAKNGVATLDSNKRVLSSQMPTNIAVKSSVVAATLAAASWADGAYTLAVSGVTATSNQEILPAVDITQEQLEALQAANIQDGGQSSGKITLKAFGDVPTVDISIRVILRGDA